MYRYKERIKVAYYDRRLGTSDITKVFPHIKILKDKRLVIGHQEFTIKEKEYLVQICGTYKVLAIEDFNRYFERYEDNT